MPRRRPTMRTTIPRRPMRPQTQTASRRASPRSTARRQFRCCLSRCRKRRHSANSRRRSRRPIRVEEFRAARGSSRAPRASDARRSADHRSAKESVAAGGSGISGHRCPRQRHPTRRFRSSGARARVRTHRVVDASLRRDADRTVRVQRGDSLWKLAEQHLGNGARWHEIAELNPEIADPNIIHVGERFAWRADAGNAKRQALHRAPRRHALERRASRIRQRPRVSRASPTPIRICARADLIFPGQSLVLPDTCPIVR